MPGDGGNTALSEPRHPLSTAQLGWWVAQQLHPAVPATVAMYLDLAGPLDIELIRECAVQAARELESPCVRFEMVDGHPHQYVDRTAELPFEQVDLTGAADPVTAAVTEMERDYSAPLDSLAGPLTVATIYRVGAQRHLLYLRSHHIVHDGFGAAAVLRRTGELYRDRIGSAAESARPESNRALSVAELLADERAYRDSARVAADRAYWQAQLDGLTDPVALGGSPAAPTARPHRVAGALDPETAQCLARARIRHDATFPELAIAAFACYLARMTGTDDLTLSLPVAARPSAALRKSAGSMSNVVPLRVRDIAAGTVGGVLAEVRLAVIGALRHQRYRYEDMQRDRGEHQVVRGGFGPVVNVLGFLEPFRLGPLTAQARLLSLGPVEDLLLNGYQLGPDEQSVSLDFQANPARYHYDTVIWHHRRFLEYFHRFLAAEADCPIRDLDPTAPAPQLPAPVGPPRLLPELLSCGQRPDAVAVRDGARTMTYRELDRASARWARELIAAGARPGEPVVVAVRRSLESVLALWAVAKSGACFVPVDPADPVERLLDVVANSGARLGITTKDVRSKFAGADDTDGGVAWFLLDDPSLGVARRPDSAVRDADRNGALRPHHRAYLIYTSGTTGAPKGVAVTHRGLGSLSDYLVDHYGVDEDSIVLHAHPPSFDAHLLELLAACAAGARLVIEPPWAIAGAELCRVITAYEVTHFLTTPAVLATLTPAEVPSLRVVVVGGEACPAELVRQWAPQLRMYNGYGPTETTIMATQTAPMVSGEPVTIGTALPGVRVELLDAGLARAPHGARAELYIGGVGVAEGYHGDPATTAVRFVADPTGTGTRLYRTGDLVCARAGGALEFLGRTDVQFAVRGRRIEPAEVEAALLAGPEIAQAAVTVADAGSPAARIIGYVVTVQGIPFDAARTLHRVRALLPAALVPAALIELDRLPVSANGKVDRTALPAPAIAPRVYRAPESALQRMVADQIGRATEHPRTGLDDDFFELGGNSLLGVAVARDLAAATGVPVTVRWLYTTPTVAALADRIAQYDGSEPETDDDALGVLLALRRTGSRPPLFCVHSAVPLAWCYAGLARYITDRPVYGLQAPSLTGAAPSIGTIDDLADSYVDAITTAQPDGPYHLLGWSLGGQIAHAIAVRLRARGAAVAVLAMLDSVVIPDGTAPPKPPRLRDLLTHLLGDEPADADALPEVTAAEAAVELATAGANLGSGLSAEQLTRLHRGYVDGVSLSHGYRPGRFDGDLLYFSATQGMTELFGAEMWRPYVTGQLIEHPVPATHAQLTNAEVVAIIGPILAAHLARSE